jgi:hypothetical protein
VPALLYKKIAGGRPIWFGQARWCQPGWRQH